MHRITPRVLCQQLGWKSPECKSNHSFKPANWCINQEKNRGKNPSVIKAFSHFVQRSSIAYLHGVISEKRRWFLKDGYAPAHQIICNYNSLWATYAGSHRVGDNVRRWIYVDGFIQITWTSCERRVLFTFAHKWQWRWFSSVKVTKCGEWNFSVCVFVSCLLLFAD